MRRWTLKSTNNLWNFFASVKLTVVLLLTLALTSIIGTLIPQNENPADAVRRYGAYFYRLFDLLGIFDMYHSWWFQLLLILLTINIVVCSIDRISATWKIIFPQNPSFNIERFRQLKNKEKFSAAQSPDELKQRLEPFLSKAYGHPQSEATSNGIYLFAEKGRWTRLGVYIVHLSVLLLLAGGLVGSFFGFEGYVNIPEGEAVGAIRIRKTGQLKPLEFEIKCEDFDISFYPNGMPKEFRSTLAIIEQNRVVLKRDIIVNDPLRYKGINIFQSSYGKMAPEPPVSTLNRNPPAVDQEIRMTVTSRESGMVYHLTGKVGQPVQLPEDAGRFVILEYNQAADFMGQNVGEAYIGRLTPPQGDPESVLLPLRFPNFDKMRRGKVVIAVAQQPDANPPAAQNTAQRYFTGLQVTRDPGVGLVYAGFIVMIVGCFITFFMSHQRICVEILPGAKKTRIIVTGTANKNKLGMENTVRSLARRLRRLTGATTAPEE
jgi:cytochrome c biogenesis protein